MPGSVDKRRNSVRQAVANQRLEGFRVSEESQKIASKYVVGEADAKQAARQIRARYGVK